MTDTSSVPLTFAELVARRALTWSGLLGPGLARGRVLCQQTSGYTGTPAGFWALDGKDTWESRGKHVSTPWDSVVRENSRKPGQGRLPSNIHSQTLKQLDTPFPSGNKLQAQDLTKLLIIETVALQSSGAARGCQHGQQEERLILGEVGDCIVGAEKDTGKMIEHDILEGIQQLGRRVEVELGLNTQAGSAARRPCGVTAYPMLLSSRLTVLAASSAG